MDLTINRSDLLTFGASVLSRPVGDGGGLVLVTELKLYAVYNQMYRQRHFVAASVEQALDLAFCAGHMRKRHTFRRAVDCTDQYIKVGEHEVSPEQNAAYLATAKPGMIEYSPELGWVASR